ncbi:hypothetical protein BDW75DRAFT_244904 [Aspergillus navahoensis]
MATHQHPGPEGAVHTLAEASEHNPHIVLTASDDRSEHSKGLEERLAELERTVQMLVAEKVKVSGDADEGKEAAQDTKDEKSSDAADEDEGKSRVDHERYANLPVVAKSRKVNLTNFTTRYSFETEVPAVEAMMVDTTITAALEEDEKFETALKAFDDVERHKAILTMFESNPYKPDAWMARIRINSVPLVNEIVKILDQETEDTKSLTFIYPFDPLIDSHEKIKSRMRELQASTTQDETGASEGKENAQLLPFLETYIGFVEEEVIPFYPRSATKIRFRDLSAIFRPGDTIYVPREGKSSRGNTETLGDLDDYHLWRLYRTKSPLDGFYQEDASFQLKCYAIDHDGEMYVCRKKSFRIYSFPGEKEASSLPVFPLRYAANADRIRQDALTQGKKFLEYQRIKLLTHNGWGLNPDSKEDKTESHTSAQYITSDVIVDMNEALQAHSSWSPRWKFPKHNPKQYALSTYTFYTEYSPDRPSFSVRKLWAEGYWSDEYTRLQKLEYCTKIDPFLSSWIEGRGKMYQPRDGDLELLPRRLFAYALEDRKFMAVDIRNLKPVEDQGIRAPSLIINKDHESMLHALIQSHFRRKELHETLGVYGTNQDIIANKGRGLVILLYGVPGVGKTSTAEKFAHSFKKPLLPITCGDLGTTPNEVERNLKDMFRLGQLWDCILLLDEADVFLSERTPTALDRNALVSVFLRMVEYYTGILFLTTNLPGKIDEAFKSRIHISLYYPHLDEDTTMRIWEMNLRRLHEIEEEHAKATGQPPLTIDDKKIRKFAMKHFRNHENGKGRWNGRQIRNAFLIASALAHFEKQNPMLTSRESPDKSTCDINPRHFKVVADASRGFELYLAETRGRTDPETMFSRGVRADHIVFPPDKMLDTPSASAVKAAGNQLRGPYGESGPLPGSQQWGSPSHRSSGGHPMDHQRGVHGGYYGGHEGHLGGTMYQNQVFGSSQTDLRSQPFFSQGATQFPSNMGHPQGSPSPWGDNQSSRQGPPPEYLAGVARKEHQDPDSDSD